MVMSNEAIDELIKGKTKEEILGENGLIKQFVKAIAERALQAELTSHLGYEKHELKGKNSGNSRNGSNTKIIKGEFGETEISIPRDRNGEFEPQFIPKGQKRFDSFDEKILSLYARGMTIRDIQAQLKDLYGVDVSPTLISEVTDSVLEEVIAWQNRGLDKVYPIVYFDALVVKIRQDKQIINKAIYLALAVTMEGNKELLGMWCSQNEGAKFWLNVLTELKNRGLQDILICCVDGLTGFPQAIETVYPKASVQLCIVHLIRQSLKYVSYKHRKAMAMDLKKIYSGVNAEEAELRLHEFAEIWDGQYPAVSKIWFRHWGNIIPFFAYPPEIRKVIYTTNAIESLNMTLRKVMKNKRIFPSDEAAFKQIYLALKNISKKWTMPIRDWGAALSRFAIEFEDRISL
jgi:putative transposase